MDLTNNVKTQSSQFGVSVQRDTNNNSGIDAKKQQQVTARRTDGRKIVSLPSMTRKMLFFFFSLSHVLLSLVSLNSFSLPEIQEQFST